MQKELFVQEWIPFHWGKGTRGWAYARSPVGRDGPHELERRRVLVLDAHGRLDQVAVGLVDHDDVTVFHDAALQALQLVAAGRRDHHHEQVHHVGRGELRLAHTCTTIQFP